MSNFERIAWGMAIIPAGMLLVVTLGYLGLYIPLIVADWIVHHVQ